MSVEYDSANEEHSAPGGRSAPARYDTVPPAVTDAAATRSVRLSAAGRKEAEIDPQGGPVNRFAIELRKLRAAVDNPSYRIMGQSTNYAPNTLSRAAGPGTKVPSWPVVAAYVRFCGGDLQEWALRYDALVEETGETRPRVFTPHPAKPGTTAIYRERHDDRRMRRARRTGAAGGIAAFGGLIATILVVIASVIGSRIDQPASMSGCSFFNQEACAGSYMRTYSAGATGGIEVRSGASYDTPLIGIVPSGSLVYTYCVAPPPSDLEDEVARLRTSAVALEQELVAELNGTTGSATPGRGPLYEARRAAVDDVRRQLDAAEFSLTQATWFLIEEAPDDEIDIRQGWINSQYLRQSSEENEIQVCG